MGGVIRARYPCNAERQDSIAPLGRATASGIYLHHLPYAIPYTRHHAPYAIRHTPYTIHHTPDTIHHTLYTVHHAPTPYTIHHTPHTYTIHHTPTPYAIHLHHTPYTIHRTPYTMTYFSSLSLRLIHRDTSLMRNSPPRLGPPYDPGYSPLL